MLTDLFLKERRYTKRALSIAPAKSAKVSELCGSYDFKRPAPKIMAYPEKPFWTKKLGNYLYIYDF